MCYRDVKKPQEIASATNKLGLYSDKMYALVGGQDSNIPVANRMLPLSFRATDGSILVLRTKPVVVDTTKFPSENVHNHQYTDLLLYRPWYDELENLGAACQDFATCSIIHDTHIDQIKAVKEQCRSFLIENL